MAQATFDRGMDWIPPFAAAMNEGLEWIQSYAKNDDQGDGTRFILRIPRIDQATLNDQPLAF